MSTAPTDPRPGGGRRPDAGGTPLTGEPDGRFAPDLAPVRRAGPPERSRDRLKSRFLGPVLHNDDLAHERLGRSTALAVFSSDALSSTAYATEEILRTLLVAGAGLAAFGKVMPITIAMVVVLALLLFSYRQTIKAYPSAGGAYVVTKDNLGLLPAQVAGVALLTDYILTVAVSVSAGVAALYSAVPSTHAARVPIAVAFIALIAWGNLRGVKESGRLFAAPTYGFVLSIMVIIVVGLAKAATGHLDTVSPPDPELLEGSRAITLFVLLHAFASGGAAVTGVEAISNGVPAFRPPEWRNARSTLMVMGGLLGAMFLGLSWLASRMHVVPSEDKTVISQIAKGVLGDGPQFFVVQLMTLLILVLAANTSFADFPRLASFQAEDAYMPRQLTKRGHRLAFSNGILFLAGSAAALVVLFGADVTHLIPLYAVGVFTSFTLSQAGMAVRHVRLREPHWRAGLAVNGGGAVATGVVTLVIAVTKFTHGAWAIILVVPFLVAMVLRLNRQYEELAVELGDNADAAIGEALAPLARTHVCLVLVDRMNRPAARAFHLARTLRADRTEVVHIAVDHHRAAELEGDWQAFEAAGLDLRVVDCPDRRLTRSAQQVVLDVVADRLTDVTVLIPRVVHRRGWHRLLHDRTSDVLAGALTRLPRVNVTFVPFHAGGEPDLGPVGDHTALTAPTGGAPGGARDGFDDQRTATPIGSVRWRSRVRVEGRVTEVVHETLAAGPCLVVLVSDGTGTIGLAFLGRRSVAGLGLGSHVEATGVVSDHRHRLVLLNPAYELRPPADMCR